jgi:hypothetical protein
MKDGKLHQKEKKKHNLCVNCQQPMQHKYNSPNKKYKSEYPRLEVPEDLKEEDLESSNQETTVDENQSSKEEIVDVNDNFTATNEIID